MRNKWYIYMVSLLMLSGCGKSTPEHATQIVETRPSVSGDYGAALPFKSSDARQKHKVAARSLQDTMYIGSGLLELSKQYFSPKEYIFQEGQFLDYDLLDASDFTTGFLGRTSDSNPIGMNPARDSEFDSGNGILIQPIILQDIYEINFLKAGEIKGISLAIVLNPNHDKITITDDKLYEFGTQTATRIIEHMRTLEKIGKDVPIFVTLYKNASSDEALPGSFFAQAMFKESEATFSKINEEWVLFKSSRATTLDALTSQQFQVVSDAIHNFLVDDVQMIAVGKYQEGVLVDLKITVSIHAKTGTEATALVQYLHSLIISNFTTLDYRLRVEVKMGDDLIALMERPQNSSDINVIMFI